VGTAISRSTRKAACGVGSSDHSSSARVQPHNTEITCLTVFFLQASAWLSADLHKQIASLPAALRLLRTEFNHASRAAAVAAAQAAEIATAEAQAQSGGLDEDGGGVRGRSGGGARAGSASRAGRSASRSRPGSASSGSRGGRSSARETPRGGGGGKEGGEDDDADGGEGKEGGGGDDEEEDGGSGMTPRGDGGGSGHQRGGRSGRRPVSGGRTGAHRPSSAVSVAAGSGGAAAGQGVAPVDSADDGTADDSSAAVDGLRPLGGVVTVELLAMPPAPSLVKGWAITRFMPAAAPPFVVRRMAHPMLGQGAAANAQAIKMRVRVSPDVLVPPATVARPVLVGHWEVDSGAPRSTHRGRWVTEDISDASFDAATRVLSFSTLHMGAHALLVPRWLDLPFHFWSLRPVAPVRRRASASSRQRRPALAALSGAAPASRALPPLGASGSSSVTLGSSSSETAEPEVSGAAAAAAGVDVPLREAAGAGGDGSSDDNEEVPQAAVFSVITSRFRVDILVEEGLCHLLRPEEFQGGGGAAAAAAVIPGRSMLPAELMSLTCDDPRSPHATWLPPGQLLLRLDKAGVNLMPQVRVDICALT
jgi:hypothetical protein